MLSFDLLIAALTAEAGLIALGLALLLVLRLHTTQRVREVESAIAQLEPALHRWLVLDEDVATVAATLRRPRPHAAFRSVARLAPVLVPGGRQQLLAHALRDEPWVAELLASADSWWWWRRFDAARLLCLVGTERDAPLVGRLLRDSNPAVRLVAFDAAARLPDGQLVGRILDDLTRRQDAVQAYQFAALARQRRATAEALLPRLTADVAPTALAAWIDASGALALPEPLHRVRALATHADADVRVHVARALRRLAEPETVPVLVQLLADEDWRVRAQAARALGALRAGDAAAALGVAVCDRFWWVRYRSALALAQIGGAARAHLEAAAEGDDALARDMARLVVGLSPAAVVEMSEV